MALALAQLGVFAKVGIDAGYGCYTGMVSVVRLAIMDAVAFGVVFGVAKWGGKKS